jgi:hypothetical protein
MTRLTPDASDAELIAKVTKLLEALVEPHDEPNNDDHKWRTCRRCLAREELEYDSSVPMFEALMRRVKMADAIRAEVLRPLMTSEAKRLRTEIVRILDGLPKEDAV